MKRGMSASKILLLCIMGYCIWFTFVSNLVNGSSFDLLQYRTIDDVAFQGCLRNIHVSFGLTGLFSEALNSYGYGWIFWITQALLTYPAYLLFHTGGSEMLLIVLPRMLSLGCAIGCSYLIYQIASIYTQKEWLKAAIVLLSPVFPTYAYFAGRFGTVCPSAFFGVLSLYLILRDEEISTKRLYQSLTAAAVCVGIKLTGIFVLPVLGLLVLSKYSFKFSKKNFRAWVPACAYFLYLTLFLTSPSIAMYPLFPQQAKGSWTWLHWALTRGLSGASEIFSASDTFKDAVLQGTHPAWVFLVLVLFLGLSAVYFFRKNQTRRFDFLCIAAGIMISLLLAVLTSRQKPVYTVMYLFPVTALLPLGLCVLDTVAGKRWKSTVCILALLGMLLSQARFISRLDYTPWGFFTDGVVTVEMQNELAGRKNAVITHVPVKEEGEPIQILTDAFVQPLSTLEYPEYNITASWDTVHLFEYLDLDFVCIDKDRMSLQPEDKWNMYLQSQTEETRANAEADKLAVNQLLTEKTLFGASWELIYEDTGCYIFQKCA